MAPDPVQWSAPGCEHSFGTATGQSLTALIELHARTAHPPPAATEPSNVKAEKVRRPTIASQGTTEDWSYFRSRWEEYKAETKVGGADLGYELIAAAEETDADGSFACLQKLEQTVVTH